MRQRQWSINSASADVAMDAALADLAAVERQLRELADRCAAGGPEPPLAALLQAKAALEHIQERVAQVNVYELSSGRVEVMGKQWQLFRRHEEMLQQLGPFLLPSTAPARASGSHTFHELDPEITEAVEQSVAAVAAQMASTRATQISGFLQHLAVSEYARLACLPFVRVM